MKGYEPQVGDVVRVLVERDIMRDTIDLNAAHVVKRVFRNKAVGLKRLDGREFHDVGYWIVDINNCDPVNGRAYITSQLAAKMDQLNQLQREIAQLESQLAEV